MDVFLGFSSFRCRRLPQSGALIASPGPVPYGLWCNLSPAVADIWPRKGSDVVATSPAALLDTFKHRPFCDADSLSSRLPSPYPTTTLLLGLYSFMMDCSLSLSCCCCSFFFIIPFLLRDCRQFHLTSRGEILPSGREPGRCLCAAQPSRLFCRRWHFIGSIGQKEASWRGWIW